MGFGIKSARLKASFAYRFPQYLKYWDFEKNSSINPYDLLPTTDFVAWWTCPNDHSQLLSIKSRLKYLECKRCPKVVVGSLLERNPDIAAQWDIVRNAPLRPEHVKPRSTKVVSWICLKGHSYLASCDNRVGNSSGCPYCSNKLANYENCLGTTYPELLKEWDYEKNGGVTPWKILPNYSKKVAWKCWIKRHSWSVSPNSRVSQKSGCPFCAGKKKWYGD